MQFLRKNNTLETKGEEKSSETMTSAVDSLKEKKERFSYVTDFKDGYALALSERLVIIDEDYEVKEKTPYSSRSNNALLMPKGWKNGYIILYNENTFSYAIFDQDLQRVSPGEYYRIEYDYFKDGYVKVTTTDERRKIMKVGVLNSDIKSVVSCGIYNDVKYLGDDLFVGLKSKSEYEWHNDESTIISSKGGKEEVLHTVNGVVLNIFVYEGKKYYYFEDGNHKYGYYAENFETFIEPKYEVLGKVDEKGECIFIEDGITGKMNFRTGEKKFRNYIEN